MVPDASTFLTLSSERLYLNTNIIYHIISNIRCYCQPVLIATLCYTLTRITYQCSLILAHLIIWSIGVHLIKPTRFINPYCVNRTNQTNLIVTIKEFTKKGDINLTMMLWKINQKVFIPLLTKKKKTWPIKTRVLMRSLLISSELKQPTQNDAHLSS